MNNEIKEILDYLDYGVNSLSISKPPFKIEYEDIKKLLDYITNLQQELEKTEECRDELLEVNDVMRKLKERYQHEKHIYKIRIEKAIEILKLCNSQSAKETIDILKEGK